VSGKSAQKKQESCYLAFKSFPSEDSRR